MSEQPTPTPRTDAETGAACEYHENAAVVPVSFARKLERELAEKERLRFGADATRRQQRIEIDRLTAELSSLRSLLLEAQKDGERLDWLDRNAIARERTLAIMERGADHEPIRWAGIEWDGRETTIRAAIDAARTASPSAH